MTENRKIEPLPEKKAQSSDAMLDLIRMCLDIAFDERLEYLRIEYKTDRMQRKNSISIQS